MAGFITTLVIAVVFGSIGNAIARNRMPGGVWGAVLAGILGSWIGAYMPLFNTVGPVVMGITVVPAMIGAAVFVFFLGLFRSLARQIS